MDEAIAAGLSTTLPTALAEPTVPVRRGWITLLFLANIGLWLAVYAPLQVLLPEQVASLHDHVTRNGVPSGADAVLLSVVMGVGAMAGLLANPVIGALSDRTTAPRGRRHPWTLGCSLVVVGGAAAFALSTPDEPLPPEHKPEHPVLTALRRLWVSPRAYPDFGWGWLTHFLVNLGNDLGTLYLLYFLADGAHYRDPQTGLLLLMALYAVALLAAGSVLGTLSDRSGRRKPFVIGSAVTMAVAAGILSASPTWGLALVAAPLLGAGYGTYWSAAPALLTQVLPAAADRAKDGLINMGYNLPLVVAPLLAGVLLGLMNSYPALFALAGVVTIAAAWTVGRVRSVP